MQDLYLAFQNEAECLAVLYTLIPKQFELDAKGKATKIVATESYLKPNYQNIDVIGVMYESVIADVSMSDEELSADLIPLPPPNYGVNIRLLDHEDSKPLNPYLVYPATPMRVWA
jgi:hypothetical protein